MMAFKVPFPQNLANKLLGPLKMIVDQNKRLLMRITGSNFEIVLSLVTTILN